MPHPAISRKTLDRLTVVVTVLILLTLATVISFSIVPASAGPSTLATQPKLLVKATSIVEADG